MTNSPSPQKNNVSVQNPINRNPHRNVKVSLMVRLEGKSLAVPRRVLSIGAAIDFTLLEQRIEQQGLATQRIRIRLDPTSAQVPVPRFQHDIKSDAHFFSIGTCFETANGKSIAHRSSNLEKTNPEHQRTIKSKG
jgi:hypothetical protein